MKKILISILFFIFLIIPSYSYSSEKIVYLDVEKIMQESIAGKSIITQLKKRENHQHQNLKKKKRILLIKKKN